MRFCSENQEQEQALVKQNSKCNRLLRINWKLRKFLQGFTEQETPEHPQQERELPCFSFRSFLSSIWLHYSTAEALLL